jgi:predicted AAA+ superfamily ATPase
MKYDIKSYREKYLDDHARIEANERNRWETIERPDKEQIKTNLARRHSQPDFDPETQLYAFEEDRIVGFITSSIYEEDGVIKGDLRMPFVAKGYEDARDPLLERVIEVLKTKGATSIRAMVSEYWGETVSVAKRNGFKFDKDTVI